MTINKSNSGGINEDLLKPREDNVTLEGNAPSAEETERAVEKVKHILGWDFELSEGANNMQELRELLPVIWACSNVVLGPILNKKMGMTVVDAGADFWEIQTKQDLQLSELLINSVCKRYPGSFSEEKDSPLRTGEKEIYQIDPMDGTWDVKHTLGLYGNDISKLTPSTILISKLMRDNTEEDFKPKASIIFEMINNFAFISDWEETEIYKFSKEGEPTKVEFEKKSYIWTPDQWIDINRRSAYLQENYDHFIWQLSEKLWFDVRPKHVWWAWTFPLQLLANYIRTEEFIPWFSNLEPISIWFNAQPDWKTWDTDPSVPLLNTFWFNEFTDIKGKPLTQNASQKNLKSDLVHTSWVVMSDNKELAKMLTDQVIKFEERCGSILEKNY